MVSPFGMAFEQVAYENMWEAKEMDKKEECSICGAVEVGPWERRCNKVLAFKNPTCEKCMAEEYGMEPDAFYAKMKSFLGERPCMGL